jgi:hypothetical protein
MVAVGSVTVLVVGVGVTALSAAPAAAKPAAKPAAKAPKSFSISIAPQAKTSSSHKKLNVQMVAARSFDTFNNQTSTFAEYIVTTKGSQELHEWKFNLSDSSVSYSPASGKGSVKTGKQAKPYGAMKLKLKASGKRHVSTCHSYQEINQPVTVTGSWSFNTRSKGKNKWGKTGGHGKLKGKGSVFYTVGQFQNCGPDINVDCVTSVGWSASHTSGGVDTRLSGSNVGTKHGSVFASRNAPLSKPKGAVRSDTIIVPEKSQKFSVSGGKATVKLGSAKGVSGTATLASPNQGEDGFATVCGNKGKMQHSTSWQAPYKNGKKALSIHEQIEGAFKLPNVSASGDFPPSIEKSFTANN